MYVPIAYRSFQAAFVDQRTRQNLPSSGDYATIISTIDSFAGFEISR
jgi:hypothetical protein